MQPLRLTSITEIQNPWKRKGPEESFSNTKLVHSFQETFDTFIEDNMYMDLTTKLIALKVSESVVALKSVTGNEPLFMCSGTIIECVSINGAYQSKILTSASLLRSPTSPNELAQDVKVQVYLYDGTSFEAQDFLFDWHYNIALVKIQSKQPLPVAVVRQLDDGICVDPSQQVSNKGEILSSFQLRSHSDYVKLRPGDSVVALGRFHEEPYNFMAAPGKFSLDCCNRFNCKELSKASCKISKCGIGGPVINHRGEVIGMTFYHELYTPFLPTNIASKCLEFRDKHGKFSRPLTGIEATNLHAAPVDKLEEVMKNFPGIIKGVIVEVVMPESPAASVGILPGDLIIQCAGNNVQSFLEFFVIILDKVGQSVEVMVMRKGSTVPLNLTLVVSEVNTDKLHRWPLPKERWVSYEETWLDI
ncbi:hypothetical protein AQUCO_04700095v1 [Aquilegia coerulea]|uniref:PDZ domain-containing protein n=1 Tax=Aquilegia coerulea TaxID=218851 RepID=A0A2G5CKY6_AQUCA|nr:hypothetical protein AQUCO_04700095v1 [Aquilegia coerulea]